MAGRNALARFGLALVLAGVPLNARAAQPADADACVCSSGRTCSTNDPRSWRSCGGAVPDANDTVTCTGTGTILNLAATGEWKNLVAQAGCQVRCTNTAPAVFSFNTLVNPPTQFTEEFFVIDGYNNGVIPPAWPSLVCSGRDVTIKWKGKGVTGATMILGGADNQIHDGEANSVNITLRGIERAKAIVGAYSEGLNRGPADFRDCLKYPPGYVPVSPPAIGDTIVFTSGRSEDWWYRVSGTGTTAECRPTDCGGSPCDLEIDRAATGASPNLVKGSRSWSSLTKIPGLGGPVRVPTPDDADADGTADSANTRPAAGDAFVVFLPLRIEGGEKPISGTGSTDPGGGILVDIGGVNLDTRYVEIAKAGGQNNEICDPSVPGPATIWTMLDHIVSPEGDWAFWNVHDFASGQGAMEIGKTHRTTDTRPNDPITFRHWYMHDSDLEISDTPCTLENIAAGVDLVVDHDPDFIDGLAFEGWHFARLHTGGAFGVSGSGTSVPARNVTAGHMLFHDIPQVPGYSVNFNRSMMTFSAGASTVQGVAVWDIGAADNSMHAFEARGVDNHGNRVVVDVAGAYVTNVDTNTPGDVMSAPAGGELCTVDATYPTDGITIHDSYFKNLVGSVGKGGNWNFNFVKDAQIDDSGIWCGAYGRHASFINPVSMTGNYVTRSHPVSCQQFGVYLAGYFGGSDCTAQTRRIVSNVFAHPGWARSDDVCAAVAIGSEGALVTRDAEISGNVADFDRADCGPNNVYAVAILGDGAANTTMVHGNVLGGAPTSLNSGGVMLESGTLVEDYNRCFELDAACIGTGDNLHDIDNDDVSRLFIDRAAGLYGIPCDSPERRSSPWGPVGPLAFGIRDFSRFPGVVTPLLDPEAFIHFDYNDCPSGVTSKGGQRR